MQKIFALLIAIPAGLLPAALIAQDIAPINGQSAVSQDSLTLKGHTLGESIADFIGRTQGGQQKLENCRTMLADSLNPSPATSPKLSERDKKEARRLKRLGIDGNFEHELTAQEHAAKVRGAAALSFCYSLVDTVDRDTRAELPLSLEADDGLGSTEQTATIDGGKLVEVKLMLGRFHVGDSSWKPAYYEDIELDMVRKIGKATSEDDLKTQNGFGAVFHHRIATWDTPSLHAEVYEVDPKINEPITTVIVKTRAEYDKQAKQAQNRPSTLD